MPTPCTVSGNLQTLTGNQIAQGRVNFQLTNTGTGNPIGISGTSLFPALTYSVLSAPDGSFSVSLWGNDNINPSNTLYAVTFRDSLGNEMGPVLFSLTGSSVNLNSATPVSNILPPVFSGVGTAGAVLLNPSVPQTISGQPLTLALSSPLTVQGAATFTGAVSSANLDNLQFAGLGTNTTLAAAVANAGSNGAIVIPPNYIGTDAAPLFGSIPGIDFRQNTQGEVGFWHGTRSMFPVIGFSGGNDYPIDVFGPADHQFTINPAQCTSSTSVGIGTTAITLGSCSTTNGGPTGNASVFSHAPNVQIVLEPGTANEEIIPLANWSCAVVGGGDNRCASGTSITVTTTKTHTQPYTVWQRGTSFINTDSFAVVGGPVGSGFNMFVAQNLAGIPNVQFGNATNIPLLITLQTDLPRIFGGGTTRGAIFYGSQAGTGTSGIFRFRNNSTDNTQNASIDTSNGNISSGPLTSIGAAAALTGTGACATITTQLGGAWAGTAKCTGGTGASTFIITPGLTAPNGWACTASDLTTAANILRQSASSATACTIAGTVNTNDVLTFTAVAF